MKKGKPVESKGYRIYEPYQGLYPNIHNLHGFLGMAWYGNIAAIVARSEL